MRHLSEQMRLILDFLAAPVQFKDVSKNVPLDQLSTAFHKEYVRLNKQFQDPIPSEACDTLDDEFFSDWTSLYVKHFQGKNSEVPKIEYFASSEEKERREYQRAMEDYWTETIRNAEALKDVTVKRTTRNKTRELVIAAMPAKLTALKHGLMERLYPDRLLQFYPVPNRMFMYALGEQLKSIQGAIKEVSTTLAFTCHHTNHITTTTTTTTTTITTTSSPCGWNRWRPSE